MSDQQCPFCQMPLHMDEEDWCEWSCGTEYRPDTDMHEQSMYCLRICCERAEAERDALKVEVARLEKSLNAMVADDD